MNRLLAGSFDPRRARARSGASKRAASESLGETRPVGTAGEGPLIVAYTGPEHEPLGARSGPFCLLDGHVDNLDVLIPELGLAPGASPERVLAAAYGRWGEELLERLRGRFALVAWDGERRQGLLAVDQLGVRPLFVHLAGSELLFASDTPFLLRLLGRRPSPSRAAVVRWMTDGLIDRGQTLYEGMRRLEGGRCLLLSEGGSREVRYWSPRYREPLRRSRPELAEELREQIGRAVRTGLPAEGPAAVLLSGGLDSASVAAVARGLIGPEDSLRAYSAVFPGHPSIDESLLIDSVTARVGLSSRRIVVHGGSMLAGSLEFLRAWGLPSLSPNLIFGLPMLRFAAQEGVSVLLDGEGGDALFGYSPYLMSDRLRRGRILSALALARRVPGVGDDPSARLIWRLLLEYGLKGALPQSVHGSRRRLTGSERYRPDWLTAESARLYLETDERWAWKDSAGPRWWSYLAHLLTHGRERLGAHDFLRRRAALAGLEGGHPYFDDLELIEFALRLPPELAFDSRYDRPLLRESMEGLIPDEVRLRPDKSFFTVLFEQSLSGPDWPSVTKLLGDRDAEVRAYVRPEVVRARILEAPPDQRGGAWAWMVWRLVTAECWLRTQSDPSFPDRLLETWQLEEPSYELAEASGAR